ncbi:MAG: trigger factor [Patescibacteria group bacterium]
MKVEVKKLPKSEVSLTIEVDEDSLAKYRTKAAEELSKSMQVPGFRAGHAPAYVVEGEIGKERFLQAVLQVALPRSYTRAVKDEKILVITRPNITIISESPLKYEARVAVMPEVSIPGYEKPSLKKSEIKIVDGEVDEVLKEMQKARASYKKKETQAEKGDRVEVDFEGFDEKGVSLENTKSKNHPLVIGENTLIPGFEEQLVGMKTGDKKEFTVTFPKDYHHKPFQNKPVVFHVTINNIEEVNLPHIDEAFVEMVLGEKKSLDEFKGLLRKDIETQKHSENRKKQEDELIAYWIKKAKVEIPPLLLEEEVEHLMEQMKGEMEKKGVPWAQFEEHLKNEKRDLKKEQEEEAQKRIMVRFVIKYVVEKEKLEVSEADVDAEVEKLLQRYPAEYTKQVTERFVKGGTAYLNLKNQILLERLFEKFLPSAA